MESDALQFLRLRPDQKSLLLRIGRTPLLPVPSLEPLGKESKIFAKAEWFNPSGSVKDRAAARMLLCALRRGDLTHSKCILDATSGNTGLSYAMLGAALNIEVELFLSANASEERKLRLRAYGAKVHLLDPLAGGDGARVLAKRRYLKNAELYYYPDQYSNPENWKAHYETTATEIWDQTGGRLTHFVCGLGTSGTFVGTSRRLKELNPNIQCISFQPDRSEHGLEGLKHMPSVEVPPIYDASIADRNIELSPTSVMARVRQLAKIGWLVGVSSGAAMEASLQVARAESDAIVVTVFPDDGSKYMSLPFWQD